MDDELKRAAAAAGLEGLLSEHAEVLRKSLDAAQRFNATMKRDLRIADEPAHVFHPDQWA